MKNSGAEVVAGIVVLVCAIALAVAALYGVAYVVGSGLVAAGL